MKSIFRFIIMLLSGFAEVFEECAVTVYFLAEWIGHAFSFLFFQTRAIMRA